MKELRAIGATLDTPAHVHVVLQGKFKNSHFLTCHIMFLSCTTKTTFPSNLGIWTDHRLINLREQDIIVAGWLFAKKEGPKKGMQLPMSHYEPDLLEVLEGIQEGRSDLIPEELDQERSLTVKIDSKNEGH